MSFLKPKPAKQSSDNANNPLLTGIYTPAAQQGVGAQNFLAQLLGVSGGAVGGAADKFGQVANGVAGAGGAQAGYDNYLQNAGYDAAMSRMVRGVAGGQAAQGLLRSGATGSAYQRQGAEINSQYFNNYLQQLQGLSGLGLQSGGLIANTGQRSSQTGGGPSTAGSIASLAGGIASIFSDRRLKTAIKRVGKTDKGLPIYRYRYKDGGPVHIGVMAQDVEKKNPAALGPKVDGFRTVNYEKVA